MQCSQCLLDKVPDRFRKDRRTKSGFGSICTLCNRISSKNYREGHLEERKKYWENWRNSNPKKYIIWRSKQRARIASIEFSISENDIEDLPEFCPVLGLKLIYTAGSGLNDPSSASLDRFDNNKGYVPGNVRIISKRANELKSNGTLDEFRKIIKYMEND